MKLKKLFVGAAIMLAAFTSCKKEETVVAPVTPVTPVKPDERLLLTSVGTSNNTIYVFEYNSDKTVKSYSAGAGAVKWVFDYQPNILVITSYHNNVKFDYSVYELKNGIAQKGTSTRYAANGSIADVYVTVYDYNNKGLLVKENSAKNGTSIGSVEYIYNVNDDLIRSEYSDPNGNVTSKTAYEYDLTLLDRSGSVGQFNSNGTGSIFPKMAKHLYTKTMSLTGGGVYNYSYTMDAQGYVLEYTVIDGTNAIVHKQTNTWQ